MSGELEQARIASADVRVLLCDKPEVKSEVIDLCRELRADPDVAHTYVPGKKEIALDFGDTTPIQYRDMPSRILCAFASLGYLPQSEEEYQMAMDVFGSYIDSLNLEDVAFAIKQYNRVARNLNINVPFSLENCYLTNREGRKGVVHLATGIAFLEKGVYENHSPEQELLQTHEYIHQYRVWNGLLIQPFDTFKNIEEAITQLTADAIYTRENRTTVIDTASSPYEVPKIVLLNLLIENGWGSLLPLRGEGTAKICADFNLDVIQRALGDRGSIEDFVHDIDTLYSAVQKHKSEKKEVRRLIDDFSDKWSIKNLKYYTPTDKEDLDI